MYVHRLAFDPELARCSPGLVNTLDAIEAAADEGLTRVEFLGGGERYKIELADAHRAALPRASAMASGVAAAHTPRRSSATIRTRLRLKQSQRLRKPVLRGPRAGAARGGRYRSSVSPHAVGGEPAAGDEARDRPEVTLGGEADEQQVGSVERNSRSRMGQPSRTATAARTVGERNAMRSSAKRNPAEITTASASRTEPSSSCRCSDSPALEPRTATPSVTATRPSISWRTQGEPPARRMRAATRRRAATGSAANASGCSASRLSGGGP